MSPYEDDNIQKSETHSEGLILYAKFAVSICVAFAATWSYAQPDKDALEGDSTQRPREDSPRGPERLYAEGRDEPTFMFCTIQYTGNGRYEDLGFGWSTDYPDSGYNLMNAIAEKTSIEIARDENDKPEQAVLRLTDAGLKDFRFIFMSDVGTAGFSKEEVIGLRNYLLQGGFLYADDFWGDRAWESWAYEIGQVLAPDEYPIRDIPLNHDLFHIVYDVEEVPQVPSMQHWRRSGGTTSERGDATREAHLRGIWDKNGRLMVVMSHNTDIADGWKQERESEEYFREFSVKKSYPLGINIVTYALQH